MSRERPSLAELQDMFQHAILTGEAANFLKLIPDNERTTRNVLLGVYEHAYTARLCEVLSNEHEFLKSHMGADDFEVMARAYIAARPSNTSNARWFASRLPDFLAEDDRYAMRPEFAELAGLERALNDAFDAPDAPTLDLAALTAYDPDEWHTLVFTPHPSARRLDFKTNALDIWSAIKAGDVPLDAEQLAKPQHILVWRQDWTSMIRSLQPEESMMWDEAAKSVPFGRLCELIAVFNEPETASQRAAQHLQTWLSSEALTAARIDKPSKPQKKRRAPTG